jgi:hypothetical protein
MFDAMIVDMETPSLNALGLAERATARGCGIILIPDLPSQFDAAVRAGHLTLCKIFRCERLLQLVDQVCADAKPRTRETWRPRPEASPS